jgi:polyisoprenoid-binding protein YceI
MFQNNRLMILTAALAATTVWAETYTIDGSHSSANFGVKHLMVSTVRGHFSKVAGTADWNDKNLGASKLEATIEVATVDTRDVKRDEHLKSADFFDAAKFPTMTFKSTKFEKKGGTLLIVGDLTIKGVTKPVTLTVEGPTAPVKDPWGNERIGASATTKINRKDFGINWNRNMDAGGVVVGDEVSITLDVELVKKK